MTKKGRDHWHAVLTDWSDIEESMSSEPLELHEILDTLPKGYRKKAEHDEEELDFDEALRKGIPLA